MKISPYSTAIIAFKHWYIIHEAWIIRFKSPVQFKWDYRNIWNTSLYKCSSDEADMLEARHPPPGFRHNNSSSWKVTFAWQKCIHNLSDYHKWRVACVVINIFKTYIYRMTCCRSPGDFNIVATWIRAGPICQNVQTSEGRELVILFLIFSKLYSVVGRWPNLLCNFLCSRT